MPSSERDTQQVRHSVDETASLLASHPGHDGGDVTNTTTSTLMNRKAEAAAKKPSYTKTHFVILITLTVFIIDVAFRLFDAPQIEIFEHIICNAYYKSNSAIPTANRSHWMKATGNSSCVVDAVQSELAILTQIKVTLDMLPSLVLAIPYGSLAETFGRKPIMFMSTIGIAAEALIDVLICRWSVFLLRTL
ncbi:MAG: hypothetical protein L6R35_005743 [Caloplaca aegaea]|nr:MAG: hypothetical protein L6R35_005743 [Caloplaca aegaea]